MNLFNNNVEQKIKAAAYLRMSTEHQKYSPDNQMEAINEYATKHCYEIIKTYIDKGKSGLTIKGRTSLLQMFDDIQTNKAQYKAILVLDVTRWGRFQDLDEAAYYDYSCKRAGVKVIYCAEQFENDGSIYASSAKHQKRGMSAEYSRELSKKVYAGQKRLITLGYKQGGLPGYGLRRMLINEHGNKKGELQYKEHKSIITDRVILVPGPKEEVNIVKQIYNLFIQERKTETEIANILNNKGVKTDLNRPFNSGVIKQILSNEKYKGNNVFNRTSGKLKTKRVNNPENKWVRCNGAFEAIIDPSIFDIAQGIFTERYKKISKNEMIQKLLDLKNKKGYLSAIIIDEAEDMPSSSTYATRFNGLIIAYELVGFTPNRDFRYIEINQKLRKIHTNILAKTVEKILNTGATINLTNNNSLLNINNIITASIVICRCYKTHSNMYRWKIRFDTSLNPDITIAVRMDSSNKETLDYYLLPSLDFNTKSISLKENNYGFIDSYRFNNLDYLIELSRVVSIKEVV